MAYKKVIGGEREERGGEREGEVERVRESQNIRKKR
jgi:hypothetical protein